MRNKLFWVEWTLSTNFTKHGRYQRAATVEQAEADFRADERTEAKGRTFLRATEQAGV